MSERVAVVGVSQVGYASAITDRNLEELIFEAASGALADARLAWRELDAVVIGASDLVDGRVISSMVTAGPAGSYMKDLLAVASSAEHAFVLAYLRLAAGVGDTALVAGWSKCSEAPIPQVEQLSLDPFYRRHVGMDGLVAAALQAAAYRDRYRVLEDAAARVVVKNRANGTRNPHAERRQRVTADDVLASPLVAWPLKALETPPLSDGACALVLARGERAGALRRPAAWVRGLGWASDTYWREPEDLAQRRRWARGPLANRAGPDAFCRVVHPDHDDPIGSHVDGGRHGSVQPESAVGIVCPVDFDRWKQDGDGGARHGVPPVKVHKLHRIVPRVGYLRMFLDEEFQLARLHVRQRQADAVHETAGHVLFDALPIDDPLQKFRERRRVDQSVKVNARLRLGLLRGFAKEISRDPDKRAQREFKDGADVASVDLLLPQVLPRLPQ